MTIRILGGGPAGLYFAILMKRLNKDHDIQVFERNPRENTFGWGVVFSDKTIASLAEPDPISYNRLHEHLRTWEDVDIVHRGVLTSVAGNRFSGIARIQLLRVLQERCEELGVQLHFETELTNLPEADLLVCADGVASTLRTAHSSLFGPTLREGKNRYIWYGTRQPFGGLTLIFRPHGDELYMAHCYKYSDELSTFIVEVDQATWRRIRRWPEERARAHLENVFSADLGGHPLLSNRSKWIRFVHVRNKHWWAKNMVLLGDALHTAHFSIGSGTKLAMEDSVALWRAFQQHPSPELALPAFEAARRPMVEKVQAAALTSQRWFETARERMDLDVLPFAYQAMTRSSRVDDTGLEKRDPAFVAAVRAWESRDQRPS